MSALSSTHARLSTDTAALPLQIRRRGIDPAAAPMELCCVTRPPGGVSSALVATASTASRMLVAVASAAMASGEGERWRITDHARYVVLMTVWVNIWVLRVVMDLCSWSPTARSPDFAARGLVGMAGSSAALVLRGGSRDGAGGASAMAIGRALSRILGILNEIPATSRKYEFVLAMADRIITDNLQYGHVALLDANRAVLSSAFSRTCELLRRSLQKSKASAAWPSRVLRLLPMGPCLSACFNVVRLCVDNLLPAAADADAWSASKPHRQLALTAPRAGSGEWIEAEKHAHELLWITSKMMACSATGEAIVRWGFASDLASLSLTAHPRVQGPIIKISALLLRELARGEWEPPREVRFRILAVWLPLFCHASNGVTCPVLTGAERWEVERAMEELISGLPWEDQEVVLGNWLEDCAASDSDWPNLQRCFDRWCWHTRKLLL